jgi:glycosyltransferase involved in cell wall biosynthesis
MAVLAIVTSSPPSVEGGHLVIARALERAAREAGHEPHVILTPECQFGRQAVSYFNTYRFNVDKAAGRPVDQVISLRFPSYAVRHPVHVCWLNHTMREYYDLWPRFSAQLSSRGLLKERVKRTAIRVVDRWLLSSNVTEVVAQSRTIQKRLESDLGVKSDVLLPPPPQRTYRCDAYGDYIFAVSRLTPLKRMDLLIRAVAEPAAAGVRAVIAGEGDARADLDALCRNLGVSHRVRLIGRIPDGQLLEHFANCRAVCFPPFSEDYGFVTAEAFASRKAVVTCTDSGGPAEVVQHGRTGLICEPTAGGLAAALGRLAADRTLAEELGGAALRRADELSWPQAVKRLVVV